MQYHSTNKFRMKLENDLNAGTYTTPEYKHKKNINNINNQLIKGKNQ